MDETIRKESEKIIKQHVTWAVGAGLVPIPFLDVVAVSGIQLDMLKQLCRVNNISYSESTGKAMLSAVTGSSFARLGASAIKAIPGIGSLIGAISMPVLSGASTYAIGHAALWHFENGGDLFEIDFGKIKEMYEELFKAGKDMAKDISQQLQKSQKTPSSRDDVLKELEELRRKRDQNLITEEEFETRKQQLLESL